MKAYLAILIVWLLPLGVLAQQEMTFSGEVKSFSKGIHPALQILIPQTHAAATSKEWVKYLKSTAKGKVDNGKEISVQGAQISSIYPTPFNLYSSLTESTDGVLLTVWVTRNDTDYISKDSAKYASAIQKYLHEFAANEYRAASEEELKAEKDLLKKLQGEQHDLVKAQDRSDKTIKDDKKSIEKLKGEIKDNEKDQETQKTLIAKQTHIVETLTSSPGETLEDAKKTLKGYQSELKKQVSSNEKMHKEINKLETEISTEEKNLETNKKAQQLKNDAVAKQDGVVKSVQTKLSGIK